MFNKKSTFIWDIYDTFKSVSNIKMATLKSTNKNLRFGFSSSE